MQWLHRIDREDSKQWLDYVCRHIMATEIGYNKFDWLSILWIFIDYVYFVCTNLEEFMFWLFYYIFCFINGNNEYRKQANWNNI